MRLVDSHCHINDKQFDADRDAVIERALAAGVETMMVIDAPEFASGRPFLYATIGVHPHEASKATDETWAKMHDLASHPKTCAVGEIGLDYHYDFSPRDVQMRVFRRQLGMAHEWKLPIVIHTREAWDDTLAMVSEMGGLPNGGIMHCFTGDASQARQALALGFHLAYGGVLTFPKADAVREAARITPEDRLLIETDCPYLAPVPNRGKRNEPAFVVETARRLAQVRETNLEAIAEVTTRNFEALCLRRESWNG
ncbi:MAG TPA: TatD family hydrolase [Candidatus Solibacter sp.]|nr:TatD family hydrolase [Candidatus Solibacter sp.]